MKLLFWRLVLPAAIGGFTGVCVGVLAGLFEDRGLAMLNASPGITAALVSLTALPLTFGVFRLFALAGKPSGSELYIKTYLQPAAHIAPRDVPGRLLGAIATVAPGGSQGFEAASALIGSFTGDFIGRLRALALPAEENRSLMAAGASAGIAAVFSSPAVGLLYGLEVPYRRDLDARPLVPAAIASSCAYAARVAVAGAHPLIELGDLPTPDLAYVTGFLLIGVLCGILGRAFSMAQTALQHLGRRTSPPLRVIGASLVFGALAWSGHELSGQWITLGPGHIAADWLLAGGAAGHALWLVAAIFVIRTAGTLVCVYGGGGGGVFTALAVTGAFIGSLVAILLSKHEALVFPFIGAACFLSAGYRIPLSCMLWVGEASGDPALTLGGAIAIAITQVLMGDESVSEAKAEARITTQA